MDDPNDLEKWQAFSHPDLAERKPNELFEPEFAERYERLHNDLWQRILRLHGTIHTLETLADFPFEYLYGRNDREFWRLVEHNFGAMALVSLHALVKDQGSDKHTILKFKGEIAAVAWLDANMHELFIQTLRDCKFDSHVESVGKRISQIRHEHIAHRLIDKQTRYLKDQLAGVSLRELRHLFGAAHSLFGALSFGSTYVTLGGDLMPGTIGGKPKRSSLDRVLDAVLRDSYFVNEPELKKEWWSTLRQNTDPEQLQRMNTLRKRIGLPPA